MPENTVEILIRARDEATKTLNQAVAGTQQAVRASTEANQALVRSSEGVSRASAVTTREVRTVGVTARFAAVSLASELSPALGTGVARLTSLASVAALSGTALGALATLGIGAVVVGLGTLIAKTREAEKVQRELNQAVALGQVPRIQKELNDLREKERTILAASFDLQVTGFENTEGLREDALAAIRNEIELRERQIQRINQLNIEGARSVESLKEQEELTKRLASAAASWAQAQGDVQAKQEALRELAPFLSREEADVLSLTEAYKELGEVTERVDRARAESIKDLEHQATEIALGQVEDLNEAIEKAREPIVRTMTSLGNAGADALFDALIGRSRSLSQAVASFFEGFARDIFRNTLTQLMGGRSQGLGLQNLFSLMGAGGSRPGFSPAPLAAIVPGTQGLPAPQTAGVVAGQFGFPGTFAGFQPGPGFGAGEEAAAGLPGAGQAGQAGAQGLGGAAGIGFGLLGLFAATRAQTVGQGAISGAFGGLSLGLGLAQLGFGSSAVLGPVGFMAGLTFGSIIAFEKGKSARREASRQKLIQIQINKINVASTAELEEIDRLRTVRLTVRRFIGSSTEEGSAPIIGPVTTDVPLEPEALDVLNARLAELRRQEQASGFLIEEVFGPGITRIEALGGAGPRQRKIAVEAAQRGAFLSLWTALRQEDIELVIDRLRGVQELAGIPMLPQARFVEIMG